MYPELVRVSRIDPWETGSDKTLWIIRGETVEDHPRYVTVKTMNPLFASACERGEKTGVLVWMQWRREGFGQSPWLKDCSLDNSKFVHDEAV